MKSNVSELVSRIEGYDKGKYEVIFIREDCDGNYSIQVRVNPEKVEE